MSTRPQIRLTLTLFIFFTLAACSPPPPPPPPDYTPTATATVTPPTVTPVPPTITATPTAEVFTPTATTTPTPTITPKPTDTTTPTFTPTATATPTITPRPTNTTTPPVDCSQARLDRLPTEVDAGTSITWTPASCQMVLQFYQYGILVAEYGKSSGIISGYMNLSDIVKGILTEVKIWVPGSSWPAHQGVWVTVK